MGVEPEHSGTAFGWRVKTQQSVDEGRLASAVGSEQPNSATPQNAGQTMKNRSAAELYFEPIELDGRVHHPPIITDWLGAGFRGRSDPASGSR
jgi:hypothetical protein